MTVVFPRGIGKTRRLLSDLDAFHSSKPLHKSDNTFFEGDFGFIAEDFFCFGDVGAGDGRVAGMRGKEKAVGFFSEMFFEEGDDSTERDSSRVAEVDDFVGEGLVEGGENAFDDVFDVGVVAFGGAVAVEGESFFAEDGSGESEKSQIGSQTGSVDAKKSETGHG